MARQSWLGGVLLLLAAFRLSAQEYRGTVRDSASRQTIPGAVLILLDSAGRTLGRNITNERGSYRIVADTRMRRMRIVRIGYRPRVVTLPPVSGNVATVDVVMTALPTMLEAVHVSSGASCSRRPDRLPALSLLEQARAGLLATIVARETNPAEMIRLRFTRALKGTSDDIERMEVKIDSSADVRNSFFAARSAAEFVQAGFLVQRDNSQHFLGPDAETLMDDAFRDGYCFHLRDPDKTRPNQVGLAFLPAGSKKDRVDVDGTLWIDTLARSLQEIRFDYIGMDRRILAVHPGGGIHFQELPNGIVFIDRWSFRIPSVDSDTTWMAGTNSPTIRTFFGAHESGGEVATARWPDGATWTNSLGTLRVHAVDAKGQPTPRRELRLEGTDYRGVTDDSGDLTIKYLLPGPYVGIAFDTTLTDLGIVLKTSLRFTAARDAEISTRMVMPTAVDYLATACRNVRPTVTPDSLGMWVIAKIFDADGKPAKHAQVSIAKKGDLGWIGLDATETTSDGIFAYCGGKIHPGDEVNVEARQGKDQPPTSQSVTARQRVTKMILRLHRKE